ncbi:MAG: DNA replication/repair protein RecF [Clostridia bacterium]|nr:DNA replication/repair protein RecF [Clostridia bacterium]
MPVRAVALTDFRNVASAEVHFGEGVNILVGDNAQGKTNLLEAIYLFALGKSFRGAKEAELIRFGAELSALRLDFAAGGREQTAVIRFSGGKRTVELNRVKLRRMSELVGTFRAVLFCPEHLSLIKEGPAARRGYLDIAISQQRPLYLQALQRYNVALRERNKLLKQADENPRLFRDTVDLWSAQLAEQAAVIAPARLAYIRAVEAAAARIFADMTGDRELPAFTYTTGFHLEPDRCADADAVRERVYGLLTSHLDRERGAGSTLWGVHRDDIAISLNDRSARLYASQGQQRSLALAMKLAEGEICAEMSGERPVFLFDDVLSELDSTRRAYLTRTFADRQVIMTTCERDIFSGEANVIRVEGGVYR